ncbi:MAG: hypothetical protein LBS95_00385, partial [Mycoplasmataceae bacterium]|nr:hypothetical protein [Mycoplasmataceae bacterium]
FIDINDLISYEKNVIGQLSGIKHKSNPSDVGNSLVLNTYFERINELEFHLRTKYKDKYEETFEELNNIKKDIEGIAIEAINDLILIEYSKKLFFYLNKFRHEDKEIDEKLNKIEKDSVEKNIDKALDDLISLSFSIKESADKYGVKIK